MYAYSKVKNSQQLGLLVDSRSLNQSAKRVNIVSLKLIKEDSFQYQERKVKSPQDAYNLFKKFLIDVDREYFIVVCLDTKNQPTYINVCHIGSINPSSVHPREVLKQAILSNAASIIVAHNHPSGDPTPSKEEVDVAKGLVEAGQIIGIELLDHLVVCSDRFLSLKEKGHLL